MSERVSISRDGAAVARAALERVVGEGGVAVFPADGLYGLACDPLRRAPFERICALKGRDPAKPSAVMYFSPLAMREMLASLGPRTCEAVGSLLPGPVTLVVANPEGRYPLACGSTPGRLGLRMIDGPLAGAMTPILQTSANRSGAEPPGSLDALGGVIADAVDLIIDGGELGGLPSTVVDLSEVEHGRGWTILRQGGFPAAALETSLSTLD